MNEDLGASLIVPSSEVDIQPLQKVFQNTTASYKYLWFLAILELIQETRKDSSGGLVLSTHSICSRMVAKAWIPSQRFKLSFGRWDNITSIFEELKKPINNFPFDAQYKEAEALKALETYAAAHPKKFKTLIYKPLLRYVPYKFLSPWFSDSADSLKAAIALSSAKDPYSFPLRNLDCIEVHSEWVKYFRDNYQLLKDFTYWNFADFLQTRNTAVPGLIKKFELPSQRLSLEAQRNFWKPFLSASHTTSDIYGHQLNLDSFALDHFLPWTFVVHNQIWNLTPMDRTFNSSKNDLIPQESFIKPLALQHQELIRYHVSKDANKSKVFFEEYENFFGIEIADIVTASKNNMVDLYKEHLDPLTQTALNMGFRLWHQM